MDSYNDDERFFENLYKRFKKSLANGSSADDLDEDDLADVYDYAGDIGDYFIQNEVLYRAARQYPRSRVLNERKALNFLALSEIDAASQVAKILPPQSVIGRLVKIYKAEDDGLETLGMFEKLIADKKLRMIDEEVIQFCRAAASMISAQWLLDNLDTIKQRVEYPITAIYEIAQALFEAEKFDDVRKLAQELTQLEPFNFTFWSFLAEIEGDKLEDYAAGLQSIDYALAINPDSRKELLMKAHYLAMSKAPYEEIGSILDRLCAENPNDGDLALYQATVLRDFDRPEDALQLLKDNFDNIIDKKSALMLLLELTDGQQPDWIFSPVIGAIVSLMPKYDVLEWVRQLYEIGAYQTAGQALSLGLDTELLSDSETLCLYFELQYRMGLYESIVEMVDRLPDRTNMLAAEYRVALLYFLSRLNTNQTKGLAKEIKDVLESPSYATSGCDMTARMVHIGVTHHLFRLLRALESGDADSARGDFDPFYHANQGLE